MQEASLGVALPKIKRSSAKRRWWMAGEDFEIFRPLIFPAASSLNKSLDKTSAPKMNKKGERGSPCLRPLVGEKSPKGLPLMRMEKVEEEIQTLIQLIQEEWNPSLLITERMKSHSILSKAFSMCKLRNMKPHFPFFCF
jgi:hypothetical protein